MALSFLYPMARRLVDRGDRGPDRLGLTDGDGVVELVAAAGRDRLG